MSNLKLEDEVELCRPEEIPYLLERLQGLASKVAEVDSGLGTEIHAVYADLSDAVSQIKWPYDKE